MWKDLARREQFVIAAPDATDRSRWRPPGDGPNLLRDLVEELGHVDTRRIYLFGYSAGAVFALYMAPLESRYFAAAAVHAGAYTGEADLGFLETAPRKVPLLLSLGARDDSSRHPSSRRPSIAWSARVPRHDLGPDG